MAASIPFEKVPTTNPDASTDPRRNAVVGHELVPVLWPRQSRIYLTDEPLLNADLTGRPPVRLHHFALAVAP